MTKSAFVGVLALAVAAHAAGADVASEFRPPPETIAIRNLDRIDLPQGQPIYGRLLTPGDPTLLEEIEVQWGSRRLKLRGGEFRSIVPRQSADQAYDNWQRWILKTFTTSADKARAEFELGRWCALPQSQLDGSPPQASRAMVHLERAARLDPTLEELYPYLIAEYRKAHPISTAPIEAMNREIETYLIAFDAGYRHPEMDFRIGRFLYERLDEPGGAAPYLASALRTNDDNEGRRRISRSLISESYMKLGQPLEALKVYEDLAASASDDRLVFEAEYSLGRLRARMPGAANRAKARAHFVKAQELDPNFAEPLLDLAALDYREDALASAEKRLQEYLKAEEGDVAATVDLALVRMRQGRIPQAEKALGYALDALRGGASETKGTTGKSSSGGRAPLEVRARLAAGAIEELRGNSQGAISHYRAALELAPESPLVVLTLSGCLLDAGNLTEARSLAESALDRHGTNRFAFAAAQRLLGHVEAAADQDLAASKHFAYAAEVDSQDAGVLEEAGVALLRARRPRAAIDYLEKAQSLETERPATLNALAAYSYRQGDYDAARRRVESARKITSQHPEETARKELVAAKTYSEQLERVVRDVERLEVWIDDFEGPDSPVLDGWEETELYGVSVERRGGQAVFQGTQSNAPDGETSIRLMRKVPAKDLERISVSIRVDSGRVSPRLALETPRESRRASAGLMLIRDFDGEVKVRWKTNRGDWETLQPAPADSETRGMVYRGGALWPDDGKFHTMEIRLAGSGRTADLGDTKAAKGFDLYFDGKGVAFNVSVPGFSAREYEVGILGATDAVGNTYAFTAESFHLSRESPR